VRSYIFGYGSLIIPESVTKSLGRHIDKEDISLVEVNDFTRLWRLVVQVIVNYDGNERPVNAVFLDIQKLPGKIINGSLIEVSEEDLNNLDIREKQYDRIDITESVTSRLQGQYRIFTYTGKPEFHVKHYDNPMILKQYLNVLDGIGEWGDNFYQRFTSTTEPNNYPIIDGNYKFLDKQQNIVTGHPENLSQL
jgi:hypothetical protein